MDSELKELLKENLKLNKENNDLLKKIRKFQKWGQTSKAVYWLVMILFVFGAWYFAQPYFESLLGYYSNVTNITSGVSGVTNISDLKSIQGLLENIKN